MLVNIVAIYIHGLQLDITDTFIQVQVTAHIQMAG